MGDELTDRPRYRRAAPAPRRPPGPLPSGRRLLAVIVGLVALAVMAVVAVAAGGGDGTEVGDGPSTTSSATVTGGTAPDAVVARLLLPSLASLGAGWVEQSREPEPVPAEADPGDPCPQGPVPEGLIVRAELHHLGEEAIVEQLSITAGVVAHGVPVPRLDDPTVVGCLQDGLAASVPEGNEVVVADQPDLGAPGGAVVTGVRYRVERAGGGPAGTFDFVLVQRGRAVVLGLLAGFDAEEATGLRDLVAVLDGPLSVAAPRLA